MGQRGARGTRLTSRLTSLLDAVLAVTLAPACASCGAELLHPIGGPVCDHCWRGILPLTPPLCDTCGDALPSWRAISHLRQQCPRCRRGRPSLARARAIGEYDGSLRAIIHALKYEGRRSLAAPLARLMRERGAEILEGAACTIPVPLHRWRRWARGFNQATDLACHLGLPVRGALRRIRATAPQTTLPAAQRHRNVRNAFVATPAAASLTGATVVIVDDVCTTGATLDACAAALLDAGVAEVRALTAARVVRSRR